MEKVHLPSNDESTTGADQLEIIYYTDPLCCWSWAMEPQLRRIQFEYNGQITWRYCMGGLLPGWNNYHDEINSVTRPIQMGPVWMHAGQLSGMPMDANIWMKDAPASSYPSCIACKSAFLQSNGAGIRYLRLLREAAMLEGKNIYRQEILGNVAERLAGEAHSNFDLQRFKDDITNENALEAFRKDMQEIQQHQVKRFPTFIIKSRAQKGIIITGYRPYSIFEDALLHVSPQLQKSNPVINEDDYKTFWGFLTKKEMEEIGDQK